MKLRIFLVAIIITCFATAFPLIAANLSSSNYILVDPEVASVVGMSSSANYKSLVQAGSGIGFGQLSSSLYKMGSGQGYTFMANVPKITCFETYSTSATTECVGLPAGDGMVGECGENGCYDRAMVQLDVQANPADTVFSIQFSTDNWSTVQIVDGTSRTLKPYANKAITDYKTKAQWENSPWNHYSILGLKPGTTYKARATALQGDFTESEPGPDKSATTALPTVTFDLDIGADLSAESNAPYVVRFGKITPEVALFQNSQRVKVDISTNAQNGISVYAKDSYSGLRSASTSYNLQSATEDLSNPASADGYGLQTSGTTQGASSLGFIVSGSTYNISGSNVGQISSVSQTRIACSLVSSLGTCGTDTPTWVTGGKILLTLGTRATINAPAVNDYQDSLTFTVSGGW